MLSEKAIYWADRKILLIADLHLGKVSHFRKHGIAIPAQAGLSNYHILGSLLDQLDLDRVLFLGDLFHSDYNKDWEVFTSFIQTYKHLNFELIQGNHDILGTEIFNGAFDVFYSKPLEIGPFILSHEPLKTHKLFNIAGHIHPAIKLAGKAKQSIILPCFFFTSNSCILPAFGAFTGTYKMNDCNYKDIFLVVENEVIKFEQ